MLLRFPPAAITASVSEVARYAGGSRYRPQGKALDIIAGVLTLASTLIQPGAACRFHRITGIDEEGRVLLPGSLRMGLPVETPPGAKSFLGAVVITLGGALEKRVKQLNQAGDVLRAFYLDAAGTALLKGLDNLVEAELVKMAERAGLHPGCRLGPGLNQVPLESQRELFRAVDPGPLGVTLNEQMVIRPAKSVSYFIFLSDAPGRREGYDCSICQREACIYRRDAKSGAKGDVVWREGGRC